MMARTLKATVTKSNLKEKLKSTTNLLSRLRHVAQEPQHGLPDVFIWMISSNKRIAYHRVPAKDVVYSMVNEERGKDCGKVQTLLLKVRPTDRSKGRPPVEPNMPNLQASAAVCQEILERSL